MRHVSANFVGDNPSFGREPLYSFSLRGQLGVILFFAVSGYCITAAAYNALASGKTVRRYAFERVRRIYPPYLAALLLGVLVTVLVGYAAAHHWIGPVHHPQIIGTSAFYWIGNAFLLQLELSVEPVNFVFWSLCYEIAFYAVVGVLLWVAKLVGSRYGNPSAALTLFLGLTVTTYVSLLSLILLGRAVFPFDLWHLFSLGGILFFFLESKPETVAGYSQRLRSFINWSVAGAVALTLAYIALHGNDDSDVSNPHSRISAALSLVYLLMLVGLRRVDSRLAASRWMRPLLWLGACTYSLYLTHTIVIPFVDILTRKAGLNGNLYWISFWIQIAVAIGFGRLFYHWVERHFISSRQKKRLVEEHAS